MNKVGLAILIYYNMVFKLKLIRRDKEGNFIPLKGTIHQKEVKILIHMCQYTQIHFLKKVNGQTSKHRSNPTQK